MTQKKTIKSTLLKVRKKSKVIISSISPVLMSKMLYKKAFGKPLNLNNPETFNEKLMWLKLNTYYKNPLVTQCADKFLVREYIRKCGLDHFLNNLIGVWDSVNDINWNNLPHKFVLKCNHGCGYNIICDDKSKLDIEESKRKLRQWMKEDFWRFSAEVNYKYIPKKIICESYLDTDQGFLPYDYKIYCFNGVPRAILLVMDRNGEKKGAFMTTNWEFISDVDGYQKLDELPSRPVSLEDMINASKVLSEPFPFVRVDFYQHGNKAIFGEMTFSPAGCLSTSQTDIDGVSMGDLLDLSKA